MVNPGQVVIYRELWAGEVMTALPMRVVGRTEDAVILHLAAGTEFRAARVPDGGPVRSLDRWVSVTRIWAGGSLVRIAFTDRWYAVDVEYDAEGDVAGYYVNFQEPLRATAQGFDTVDLVLDIVVDPDGTARMKDEDDFAAAVTAGHIDPRTAALLRAEAARLTTVIARDGTPIDVQRWVSWRPPPGWGPLTLADGDRSPLPP